MHQTDSLEVYFWLLLIRGELLMKEPVMDLLVINLILY